MRVLVTGGVGFIGSHVVEALINRGYSVSVLEYFPIILLRAQIYGPV